MPNTYNICLFFYIVVCVVHIIQQRKKKRLWATELIKGSYSRSEDGAVQYLERYPEGKRKRE